LSAAASTSVRTAIPFSAAVPLTAGPLSQATIVKVLLGASLVGIVAAIPLPWMLAVYGALGLLVAMLIAPTVGLYAVLVAIAFSPTFGIEDASFSISAFEPLLLLVFLFWLLQGVTRQQINLPREGLFGGMILLLTLLFLAGGNATSYPLAFKETLKWVLLVLAYIYTRSTIRTDRAARGLLIALFLTGSAEAIMGAVQFFLPLGPPAFAVGPFIRAHGMFGQPNPFAGYLGTILPIALAMTLVPQPGKFRVIAGFSFLMIALGIFLSLSRGAWLGLAISLGVMAMAWSPRARKLIVPLAGAIVLVIALAMLGLLPQNLATRITSATDNFGVFDVRNVPLTSENFAVVERMAHWQAGWEMFRDYPFLGVAPGNYPAVYEQYYIPPWKEPLGHAHNYYLNMAAEAGVPGLLALLTMLGLAFRALRRRIRAADGLEALQTTPGDAATGKATTLALDPPFSPLFARALALGLLGSLAMFSIHNLFDNLLVHGVGIQIGVLLGLIGGVSNR
jgi:putative inorganic carbon (HCO3(-)) transporter